MDNEVLYKFSTRNMLKANLFVYSVAIVAWIDLVVCIWLFIKVGWGIGTPVSFVMCVLAVYDMTPELIKLFPSIKKKGIREYDAVMMGVLNDGTAIFSYLRDKVRYSGWYYVSGLDEKVINELLDNGGKCRIKVNCETHVLIEMKRIEKIDFGKERKNKLVFEALKYSDISSEVWYAYGGIATVVFFILLALVCVYAQISGYDKNGLFLGWSIMFYVAIDYIDMIKSLKCSFDVKKTKEARRINKVGRIVDAHMIENSYVKLRKIYERSCVELSVAEGVFKINKYYIYIKRGDFLDILKISNACREEKINYYEGTNIVRKIETID